MRFLILIYDNPESRKVWESLTEEQQREGVQGYRELNAALDLAGQGVVHEALADADQTRQVTIRDGRIVITDGPFAEVKEQLAGFYLVDCETIDKAVEYAAMIPEATGFGIVEVRPIMDLSSLGI